MNSALLEPVNAVLHIEHWPAAVLAITSKAATAKTTNSTRLEPGSPISVPQ
jgi:hypothetical protein